MALTEHQSDILDQSLEILERSKRLLIKGSAGVGKTYLVNTLIDRLKCPSSKEIYCSAPTNKAVAVLKGKVDERYNTTFITTHSALKLKRVITNYKTGEYTFKPSYTGTSNTPLNKCGILIIDEASMLGEYMLELVEKYSVENNVTVIFIGDEKQLNPVKEVDSPVFTHGYPEVELTKIIRQGSGNPIIDLSRNLDLIPLGEDVVNDGKGFVYSKDKIKVIETLATVNGTDELKYLAWTNKDVDAMNNLVRKRLYWPEPKKIELGETLVFNSPNGKYFTNEEIKVEKLLIETREFTHMNDVTGFPGEILEEGQIPMYGKVKFKVYVIDPDVIDKDKVLVIHEDSEKHFIFVKNLLSRKAKMSEIDWKDYYEFVEQFADLKYNHALTVHKSQGSTFKQVIMNVRDMNINKDEKERRRLLYTAVTRASDLLILYNH